jgi:primosomal protein N' (replication factor Y) (superfamily II helicase)
VEFETIFGPMGMQTQFVDVIVPLAVPKALTYRVPQIFEGLVCIGQRVVVPLGKSKLITGIIRNIHNTAPSSYSAKYIEALLDEHPVIHQRQFDYWDWMSSYYHCHPGEVLNAALPAGLKLNSETKFTLVTEWLDQYEELTERESQVIELLRMNGQMSHDDLARAMELKGVHHVLKTLLNKNYIASEEELIERYKPKTIDLVELAPELQNDRALSDILAELEKRKAIKQVDVLLTFLQLNGHDTQAQNEVHKAKLLEKAGCQSAVLSAMIDKGIFVLRKKEIGRLHKYLLPSTGRPALADFQQAAVESIRETWKTQNIVLFHGVTSSGKTEVYSQLIRETLDRGQQVLFLLPEIALTTQIIERMRRYFGKEVGVYHSGHSDHERVEVWHKVLSNTPGECELIVGARSAVFLPFQRLGLVIVDEEHETSYKQHDPAPRYQGRDAAIVLAALFNAKVILGSATPSVESYRHAQAGKYALVTVNQRFGGVQLPAVEIVDLRPESKSKSLQHHFSKYLIERIDHNLADGKQVILFQNRRGYTPVWECHQCNWIPQCTRCDVSLTYHKHINMLKCHYCGYSAPPVTQCTVCGSHDIRMLGFGTEKIEDDVKQVFPQARVGRMDLETTRNKNAYQKIIADFEAGVTNILIGTQMITKGLDFDRVGLVGILSADKLLGYPDFRSMERAFQLMMQVAGRAGRKKEQGHVIIQTFAPQHWLLQLVQNNDYLSLYQREIEERKNYGYPPFVRFIKIILKHKDEQQVSIAAQAAHELLHPMLKDRLLGPEKPYIARINTYFLQQLHIKLDRTSEGMALKQKAIEALQDLMLKKDFKGVRLIVDVDPM